MIFMIKFGLNFICIFIIYACSSFNTSYFQLIKEGIFTQSISQEYLNGLKYSYAHIYYNKSEAIFVLSSSSDGLDIWIGQNYEKIITYKGLIIETSGLINDFHFFKKDLNDILKKFPGSGFKAFYYLSSPELNHSLLEYKFLSKNIKNDCDEELVFKRIFTSIGYKSNDKFCFEKGRIKTSEQTIDPLNESIKIKFVYK